jgi:hypothetical protein
MILGVDRIVDVSGQHSTKYLVFREHSQPVYGGAEECSLDWDKTCFEVHRRFSGLWPGLC